MNHFSPHTALYVDTYLCPNRNEILVKKKPMVISVVQIRDVVIVIVNGKFIA